MAAKRSEARTEEMHELFWETVEPLLGVDRVDEGTLMGFPCVRVGGEFLAMPKHDTGDLVVKLPRKRVAELIAEGVGEPFGPGKKVFKEWILVASSEAHRWRGLLDEARAFVDRGS